MFLIAKFDCITKALVKDELEHLNPSQWDPTGKNINPNVAASTQAVNIPVATSTQRNPTGATNVPATTRFVSLHITNTMFILLHTIFNKHMVNKIFNRFKFIKSFI